MKRPIYCCFSILLSCLLLLSSCGTQPSAKGENGWDSKPVYVLQGTATDQGYYFLKSKSFLSFFDFASKKSVILCSKQGCSHEDESCYAYVDSSSILFLSAGMFCYGDHLYLLENKDGAWTLTRRGLDGGNYETVLHLMSGETGGQAARITDYKVSGGVLYYQAEVLSAGEEGEVERRTLYRRVDLDSGKNEAFFSPSSGSGNVLISVKRNQVIFTEWTGAEQNATLEEFRSAKFDSKEYLSSDQMKVLLWDAGDGSVSTLFEDNRWNFLGALAAYEDYLYLITWDSTHTNNGILRLNMKTGEQSEVLPPQYPFTNFIALDSEHIMLLNQLTGKWHLYSMKDFSETSLDFLPEKADLVQAVKDGYIVARSQFDDSDSFQAMTYSYLSAEDLEAGNPNFFDFYTENYR